MPTLERDGQTIAYDSLGAGERTVLLAHNLLLDRTVYAGQVARLAACYRVLNVDLRGHGDSRGTWAPFGVPDLADDLVAVLDQEGVERAALVGTSLGASTAMEVAVRYPARVEQLVLAGASAAASTRFDGFQNTLLAGAVRILGPRRVLMRNIFPVLFGETFRDSDPTYAAWEAKLLRADKANTWRAVRTWVRRASLQERISAIACPTLVVVGSEDVVHPLAHGEAILTAISGARLETLPAGHSLPVEEPEAFAALLLEFLGSQPESSPAL